MKKEKFPHTRKPHHSLGQRGATLGAQRAKHRENSPQKSPLLNSTSHPIRSSQASAQTRAWGAEPREAASKTWPASEGRDMVPRLWQRSHGMV